MTIDYYPASPDSPNAGQSRHIITGLSSALPASATAGQLIYETDTGTVKYWSGSAWRYLNQSRVHADRITVGSTAVSQADGVAIGGSNAALWIHERTDASSWAIYADGGKIRINGGGTDFLAVYKSSVSSRIRLLSNVVIGEDADPPAGDWHLMLVGAAGTYTQFMMKSGPGAHSGSNPLFYFRLERSTKNAWIRSSDNTTDKEWLGFDWANDWVYFARSLRCAATTPIYLNPVPNAWLQSNGCLRGAYGTAGGALKTRAGGNDFTADWGGPLSLVIDVTTVKTFVIDHPVDPERYLVHACVEGPTADVVYRGQSQLENGWVEIPLPDYFEALTDVEGRSVQLTCIADDPEDEWCPVLHATYPRNGRFFVGLGSGVIVPDQRFWWEVKAVRKDVGPLKVEPRKNDVKVMGEGPYTYYREKE